MMTAEVTRSNFTAADPPLPKPLFIALRPYDDEALLSLLLRVSEKNVLGRLQRLVSLAGIDTARVESIPFTGIAPAPQLSALLSLCEEEFRRRTHPPTEHPSADECIDWYGTPLPRRYVETRQIRFDDTGGSDYVRATWAIKPLDFCAETRNLLRSSCDRCGAEQRWASVKRLGFCQECKASLAQPASTGPSIGLDAYLAASLVSVDEGERMAAIAHLPAPFNSWQAGDVFQAVVELGLIRCSPVAPPGCKRLKAMSRGNFSGFDHHQLGAGFAFVRGWPESLHHHVKQVTHGRSGAIRILLGRLGKYLDQNGLASPLRRAMDLELPNAIAAMDVPIKSYKAGGLVVDRRAGVVTVSEAALLFDVDKKVISKLQTSAHCFVSRGNAKSSVILLNRDGVESAMKLWRGGVTFPRAATVTGIPPYVIPALVGAGLLQAVSCPDARLLADGADLVTARSVGELRQMVTKGACEAIYDPKASSLRDAMVRILHPTTWVEVIEGLVRGEIAHTSPNDDRRFLHTIFVAPCTLEKFRLSDQRRLVPDELVSGVVAADLLAVSNTLISGAVGAGLIRGRKRASQIDIPLSEVRRYGAEFIGAEEVLRDVGVRPQDLAASMREAGFMPVGQMYNTYYWRRSEVRKLLGSQVG